MSAPPPLDRSGRAPLVPPGPSAPPLPTPGAAGESRSRFSFLPEEPMKRPPPDQAARVFTATERSQAALVAREDALRHPAPSALERAVDDVKEGTAIGASIIAHAASSSAFRVRARAAGVKRAVAFRLAAIGAAIAALARQSMRGVDRGARGRRTLVSSGRFIWPDGPDALTAIVLASSNRGRGAPSSTAVNRCTSRVVALGCVARAAGSSGARSPPLVAASGSVLLANGRSSAVSCGLVGCRARDIRSAHFTAIGSRHLEDDARGVTGRCRGECSRRHRECKGPCPRRHGGLARGQSRQRRVAPVPVAPRGSRTNRFRAAGSRDGDRFAPSLEDDARGVTGRCRGECSRRHRECKGPCPRRHGGLARGQSRQRRVAPVPVAPRGSRTNRFRAAGSRDGDRFAPSLEDDARGVTGRCRGECSRRRRECKGSCPRQHGVLACGQLCQRLVSSLRHAHRARRRAAARDGPVACAVGAPDCRRGGRRVPAASGAIGPAGPAPARRRGFRRRCGRVDRGRLRRAQQVRSRVEPACGAIAGFCAKPAGAGLRGADARGGRGGGGRIVEGEVGRVAGAIRRRRRPCPEPGPMRNRPPPAVSRWSGRC